MAMSEWSSRTHDWSSSCTYRGAGSRTRSARSALARDVGRGSPPARGRNSSRLDVSGTRARLPPHLNPSELTEEAERRGLVLALPAVLDVAVVGDTGGAATR